MGLVENNEDNLELNQHFQLAIQDVPRPKASKRANYLRQPGHSWLVQRTDATIEKDCRYFRL